MKDLLKKFHIEKTLRQLSDKTIDQLLTTKAGVKAAEIQILRKNLPKKEFQIYQVDNAQENMECYRILRTAFFFHQYPDKVTALRKYLTGKGENLEKLEVAAAKSEADHVTQLYLAHPTHVADYFTICFHTCQSRRYVQRRTDYVDVGIAPSAVRGKIKDLAAKLMTGLKNERGTGKSKLHQFEHANKLFVIMEFNDLPTYVREFENDQPEDHFRRFALDLTYVFDLITGAVDVIADSAELRQQMHEVSAAVIYGKEEIAARPPKNEVFDLQKLMDMLITGTPLSAPNTHTGISRVIANEVTLRRQKPPFWQSTLRAGFTLMGEYMGAAETYLRLALKAQSQSRATLETLAAIKNPPMVFAKQANITSGPQQVNNGTMPENNANRCARAPVRAGNSENQPNKLLEESHEERMDTRAPQATSGADPELETVGKRNRPPHG